MGRRYGLAGPWVLRGVDLGLPARALVRIEGANGTGKSTLLRLLAGIDAPTEGRISGGGPRTAYVPERFPAALPFTAAGYLVHLGRVHGLRTAEAAGRAEAWLTRFGAAGHARTPMAELSKGTAQKVAVAQALLAGPELLVLDEAWTGLDTAARDELDRAVAERVAAGGTVVLLGAAVGALCTRPVLHRRGWSVVATVLAALLALVTSGSPAKYAVTGLVTGSLTGTVRVPFLPLVGAAAVAAGAVALACKLTSVRG